MDQHGLYWNKKYNWGADYIKTEKRKEIKNEAIKSCTKKHFFRKNLIVNLPWCHLGELFFRPTFSLENSLFEMEMFNWIYASISEIQQVLVHPAHWCYKISITVTGTGPLS